MNSGNEPPRSSTTPPAEGNSLSIDILDKWMAFEPKNEGVVCVNVNPGWVQTDMGGQRAQFTPEQSVQNIITHVLSNVGLSDTGKFLNFDGTEHPW